MTICCVRQAFSGSARNQLANPPSDAESLTRPIDQHRLLIDLGGGRQGHVRTIYTETNRERLRLPALNLHALRAFFHASNGMLRQAFQPPDPTCPARWRFEVLIEFKQLAHTHNPLILVHPVWIREFAHLICFPIQPALLPTKPAGDQPEENSTYNICQHHLAGICGTRKSYTPSQDPWKAWEAAAIKTPRPLGAALVAGTMSLIAFSVRICASSNTSTSWSGNPRPNPDSRAPNKIRDPLQVSRSPSCPLA